MIRKIFSPRTLFALVIFGLFAIYGTFFTVAEGEAVIVTRLGAPIRNLDQPGPYWKLPTPIDRVERVDIRRQVFTTPEQSTFTQDKKNVVLTTFVVWHVADPLKFVQSVRGDLQLAQVQLTGKTDTAKNTQLGRHDLSSLVSLRSEEIKIDQIEQAIRDSVNEGVEALGIAVDQIGIQRIAFPKENMPAVLERMQVERLAEAKRLQMEGERRASEIRNKAHIESQTILRKGREEASRILAEANKDAGKLLADAYHEDEDFYRFWLSLQASKKLLGNKPTLIFRTDQPPFDVLTGKKEWLLNERAPATPQDAQDPKNPNSYPQEKPAPPISASVRQQKRLVKPASDKTRTADGASNQESPAHSQEEGSR